MELGRKSLENARKSLEATEFRTILNGSGRKKLKFLEFRQENFFDCVCTFVSNTIFTFLFTLGISFFPTFSSRVRRSTDSRSFRDFSTQTENIFPSLWPSGFPCAHEFSRRAEICRRRESFPTAESAFHEKSEENRKIYSREFFPKWNQFGLKGRNAYANVNGWVGIAEVVQSLRKKKIRRLIRFSIFSKWNSFENLVSMKKCSKFFQTTKFSFSARKSTFHDATQSFPHQHSLACEIFFSIQNLSMDECRGKGRKFSSSFPSFYITEGKLLCNPRLDFFRFSVRFSTFQRFWDDISAHTERVDTEWTRIFMKMHRRVNFRATLFLRIKFFAIPPQTLQAERRNFWNSPLNVFVDLWIMN